MAQQRVGGGREARIESEQSEGDEMKMEFSSFESRADTRYADGMQNQIPKSTHT